MRVGESGSGIRVAVRVEPRDGGAGWEGAVACADTPCTRSPIMMALKASITIKLNFFSKVATRINDPGLAKAVSAITFAFHALPRSYWLPRSLDLAGTVT